MSFIQTKSGEQIAVGKILCVGANYLDHIAEMNPGKTPAAPSEPVIFMKPSSAIVRTGGVIVRPDVPGEMHHEVELIAVISKRAKNLSEKEAVGYVLGYGVGLDLTLRDLQATAKKAGRPWTIAKGFDTSAVVSDIEDAGKVVRPYELELRLWVNDSLKQKGSTGGMIFKVPFIVAFLSKFFTLERGDIIYTGTPPGVGPLVDGDRVRAELGDVATVEARVVNG
ncbi:MAG: fumarylacetoacetate hydrolase family protein [Bacteroidetes bacterium]|nr:fumarylacetoacetate hydrolase family protein [Bacteroidota bacterium]